MKRTVLPLVLASSMLIPQVQAQNWTLIPRVEPKSIEQRIDTLCDWYPEDTKIYYSNSDDFFYNCGSDGSFTLVTPNSFFGQLLEFKDFQRNGYKIGDKPVFDDNLSNSLEVEKILGDIYDRSLNQIYVNHELIKKEREFAMPYSYRVENEK